MSYLPQTQIGKLREDDGKDRENIKMATLNPEFFRAFDFNVTLPGESQLKVKVSSSRVRTYVHIGVHMCLPRPMPPRPFYSTLSPICKKIRLTIDS